MRVLCPILTSGAAAVSLLVPLAAHDCWIVPPRVPVAAGETVRVTVATGMDFPASLNSQSLERIRGRWVGPDGVVQPLQWSVDEANKVTVGEFACAVPGACLVYLESRPGFVELEAAKFNEYLLHDGLPQILAERMAKGELERPARERYQRYVKALLAVDGDGDGPAATWKIGHKLEIVPLANPLAVKPGGTLAVQVIFDEQPLAGANLCWDHPGNGERFSGQTWTDENGRALVPISRPGLTTLRMIHMTRPGLEEYEWESFWTSFTFEVAPG